MKGETMWNWFRSNTLLWWIIGFAIVLIVLALLKFNLQIGSNGIHITQDLIH